MKNQEAILEKLKDLYVTVRRRYIKQNDDGTYTTFINKEDNNVYSLSDNMLLQHIKQKHTYGVFASTHSKFICFDVDIPDANDAKRTVFAIYEALENFGISSDYVFTSLSGSKGYHVEIFFDKVIQNDKLEVFFNHIIKSVSQLLNMNLYGKIELRPTENKGVKLPLGKNLKNKNNDNVCWYVDIFDKFNPIPFPDYILNIKKFPSKEFYNLLNREYEPKTFKRIVLTSGINNGDEILTIDELEQLHKQGLTEWGTRYHSLCKLARYFLSLGYTEKQCEEELIHWLSWQIFYKTPIKQCHKDIARITRWTYSHNSKIITARETITIYESELRTIINSKTKQNEKLVLFSLLLHSKRFSDRNNHFFMTYDQLHKSCDISVGAAFNNVKKLSESGFIKIVRQGERVSFKDSFTILPNVYKIEINSRSGKEFKVKIHSISEYKTLFFQCIKALYTLDELKILLSRRQYENFREEIQQVKS
ncbi:hypothetical protein PB1_02615 [Bacillus methanolicus PB1]|uniref:TOTE conflict system primase domain-containing protein n=1 Tax=Bacillus methanolicus PB1 TaxID=997296 RepID=I3E5M5_BACMT|nr:hypothetical protein [Bacillus methanolicus]EIJ81796.1 hypothetical protein PB1_02615 [Bacillus methanolicus PB1]